jgi:hypothetical protein
MLSQMMVRAPALIQFCIDSESRAKIFSISTKRGTLKENCAILCLQHLAAVYPHSWPIPKNHLRMLSLPLAFRLIQGAREVWSQFHSKLCKVLPKLSKSTAPARRSFGSVQ